MNYGGLSEECLQRATYLEERDDPAEIATYDAQLDSLLEEFGDAYKSADWIKRARQGARARSSLFAEEQATSWASFLNTLIHAQGALPDRELLQSIIPKLDEISDSIVFGPAFRNAALFLVASIYNKVPTKASQVPQWSLLADLVLAYLWRLKEHSQYVLYTHYATSGMTYSAWCESFQTSREEPNPWVSISSEYPLLIRILHNTNRQFIDSTLELFVRLARDRSVIETRFGIAASDKLIGCDPALSDPHQDGRSVMRLSFDSGSTVIYKPKDLLIEYHFNNFLTGHADITGFDPLSVINMADYGWVEDALRTESPYAYIPSSVGRASAWLWLLNATDMHTENLSPGKRGVRGLDLETLFSAGAIVGDHHQENTWRDQSITSTLLFDAALAGSTTAIGYSGFNAAGFTRIPYSKIAFSVVDDQIVASHIPAGSKIPVSQSENNVKPEDAAIIAESFLKCALSLQHPARQLIETVPDESRLRIVFRPTNFYYQMLNRLRQPKFLRDGALASIELLKLHHSSRLFNGNAHTQAAQEIINDEIRQLKNGDVPFFWRLAGERILGLSNSRIENFFTKTAKQSAEDKLNSITHADVMEQYALLSVALGRPSIAMSPKVALSNAHVGVQRNTLVSEDELVPLLEAISLDLIGSAFCPKDSVARWVCIPGGVDSDGLRAEAGDMSLFSGSLGIFLTLQVLDQTLAGSTVEGRLTSFLDQQSVLVRSHFSGRAQANNSQNRPLGFSGTGGDLFAYAHLFSMAPSRWDFLEFPIDRLLDSASKAINSDKWLDVIAGSAGLVFGCEQVIQAGPEKMNTKAHSVMRHAAMHLVQNAKCFDSTMAWTIPSERLPLLGYAHGWAGIISALQVALSRCRDPFGKAELEHCISKAAGYATTQLTKKTTWLDYRGGKDQYEDFDEVNRSWCNGTSGILRGLLSVKSYWTKETEEAARSASMSLGVDMLRPWRFCCGYSGEVDAALDCLDLSTTQRTQMIQGMANSLKAIISRYDDDQIWECVELAFPSLYQGKSGIAYTAARLLQRKLVSLSGAPLCQKL